MTKNERAAKIAMGIRVAQASANLTNIELAEKMGMTKVVISYWRNGHRCPTILQAEKLANACNVELRELLSYMGI